MDRRLPSLTGTAAALLAVVGASAAAAPAFAADAPQAPALLPAVTRTLDATGTTARACTDPATRAADAAATDAATYRAPMSGFLTVKLAGKGDWDLVVKDATTGKRLGASQGFGSTETAQAWVEAGQEVVAEGCRRAGAGDAANVGFTLADIAPPAALAGTPSLVRVTATDAQLSGLERMGLDVTHNRGEGWADVVVSGTQQAAQLAQTGLKTQTRDANLILSYARARLADRAYTQRVGENGSPLPSGRTTYRTYDDIQAELKQLATDHPDKVRKVVFGTSHQGREISGIEIADDVNADDGRPVFFLMGNHHAREWPSAEAPMELANLLVKDSSDRVASLRRRERIVILPVVNVDGYVTSRSALDPIDTLAGSDSPASVVEAIAPPGGIFAYRRKNCDGEILPPQTPCELTWGVDNNRNYGNLWGGPGSSADVTSQSYHGPGPRSEPETQAVWNFARTHHVTTLVSLHTVAALVLRPPGLSGSGLAPDEARMKEIGDAMGHAAGYESQFSWELYDTAGTTEDDTYAATGGYGYTIEMGPPDGQFHEPYEKGVIAEWTGENDHAKSAGGLREALLIAAEAAADPKDHAIVRGTAPAGTVLRLKKALPTVTSPYCAKGIEPVLTLLPAVCLTGEQEPITLTDTQDTTTTVPASGRFEWHVGPSTRPFVGREGRKEAYALTCERADGTVLARQELVIDRGQDLTVAPCGDAGAAPDGPGTPGATPEGPGTPGASPSAPSGGTTASTGGGGTATSGGATGATGTAPSRSGAAKQAAAKLALRFRAATAKAKRATVRLPLACPATATAACTGTVTLKRGRTALGSGRFRLAAGRSGTATVRLTTAAHRALRTGRAVTATATVQGTAGSAALTGTKRLTLRR